jgi:hypothetical protein
MAFESISAEQLEPFLGTMNPIDEEMDDKPDTKSSLN